jgi:hypothetical protein
VARRIARQSDSELRAHLVAEATAFRDVFLGAPREPIDGRPATDGLTEQADAIAAELDKPVQQLASGDEYRLRRNDLPDWHAERFAGPPYDEFVLGADDALQRVT